MKQDSMCYVCENLQSNGYCVYYCKYLGFKEYKGECDGFSRAIDSELLYTNNCTNIDSLISDYLDGKM